jgi:hypothetical protein
MRRYFLFVFIVVLCVGLCGCDPESDEQCKNIGVTLLDLKDAINAADRAKLSRVISDEYADEAIKKPAILEQVLNKKLYISGYNLEKIDLNTDKNRATTVAEWRFAGGDALVRIPVFQREVSLNITVYDRMRFTLQREGGDVWRIIRMEPLARIKEGRLGVHPPSISSLEYMPEPPRRGDSLEVRMRIERGAEDRSIFLAVNGIPVGSYTQSGLPNQELSDTFLQVFRIPSDIPEKSEYPIEVIAFEGRVDPLQLSLSDLDGVHYKLISLVVR